MAKAERAANATTVPRAQPKLVVGAANDPLEREADDVADRIMKTSGPLLQRCPGGCPTDITSSATDSEEDHLQRTPETNAPTATDTAPVDDLTATAIESQRRAGRPLPSRVRAFFEGPMGADFAGVRVHTGADAVDLAARVNARAFTVGQDVFFGAGEYAPATTSGRRLLAHELTHTMQQQSLADSRRVVVPTAVVRRASQPAPETTPPPDDLDCPIGTEADDTSGLSVGFAALSAKVADDDAAALQNFARNWHAAGAEDEVVINGYASAEGRAEDNWRLSCARALAVAEILTTDTPDSPGIPSAYLTSRAAGETDRFSDALAPNRTVTVATPFSVSPVEPTPDVPAKEQWCFDVKGFVADTLGLSAGDVDTLVNTLECACLWIKLTDIFEDLLAKIPVLGLPLRVDLVQNAISLADGACAFWDWFQLIHKYGTKDGPCWNPLSITASEWAWIAAFAATIPVDIFSSQFAGLVIEPLQQKARLALIGGGTTAGGGTGAAGGSPGGPPGSAFGAIVGAEAGFVVSLIVAEMAERFIQVTGELTVDLGTLALQEWIAHGTPLPTEGAAACADLADKAAAAARKLLESPPETVSPGP